MSKIELTEEQVQRLREAWSLPGPFHEALENVGNELVAMGLVRPATDDLAARVAALEAKVNGKQWDKAPDTYDEEAARGIAAAHNTPDPHAAAKGEFQEALDRVDARAEKIVADIPPGQRAIISQSEAKPRTDADRLGEVARSEWLATGSGAIAHWNRIALAVRKAVLAAQLEPTEEERVTALSAWYADSGNDTTATRSALRAAARVRLEKAEGEP